MIAKKTKRKSHSVTTPVSAEANGQRGHLARLKLLHRDHELPIRILNTCQVRSKNADPGTVAKYVDMLVDTEPPCIIVVVDSAGRHYIADGHNRTAAALDAGRAVMRADVYSGTHADAKIIGLQANQHGLPLTIAEKKAALDELLDNNEHAFSDSALAKMVGLDRHTVERRRRERECGDFIGAAGKIRRLKSPEEMMAQAANSFVRQVDRYGIEMVLKAMEMLPPHIREDAMRQLQAEGDAK